MKIISFALAFCTLTLGLNSTFANQRPFPYEKDSAVIVEILKDQKVRDLLRKKGEIKAIFPVDRNKQIFLISTEECELKVQMVTYQDPTSPFITMYPKILIEQSSGNCQI
jgi:hypothetical protein